MIKLYKIYINICYGESNQRVSEVDFLMDFIKKNFS